MTKKLPGVYQAKKKDNSIYYRASITFRKKHISLGSYDTMMKAHAAYLEAASLIDDNRFSLSDYSTHRILALEKWVSLINFRDNGIYFATPIYVKNRFFEYYLSTDLILKFDIEDLFYYSTRKIMKRGGHFFVADYGMQVNILNRYGIKNYGVPGRDYVFANGDSSDFRYENIKIINTYHGVSRIQKKGRNLYRVKIHIRGNYTVGTYETENEAAIAYNKAVDCLKKAGITKNFPQNYIEGISPSVYADIYTKITISPKVQHYKPPT